MGASLFCYNDKLSDTGRWESLHSPHKHFHYQGAFQVITRILGLPAFPMKDDTTSPSEEACEDSRMIDFLKLALKEVASPLIHFRYHLLTALRRLKHILCGQCSHHLMLCPSSSVLAAGRRTGCARCRGSAGAQDASRADEASGTCAERRL